VRAHHAWWVVCLILASAPRAPAQSPFDSWTTENGLPQNSINDIVQTRDGYLWLATFGGLVRFDGSRFVVFDRSTDGIKSQRIRRLHEDRSGTLWASTEEGMLIRYRSGRFTSFGEEHGLPAANTMRIEESDDGRLWITLADAIVRFDGEHAVAFVPSDFPHGIARARIPGQFNVWWSHDSTGLHVLAAGRVRTYPIDDDLLGGAITHVNIDRHGNVWVRTNIDGVLEIHDGRVDRHPLDGMRSKGTGFFHADRRGNIWFGEMNGRIYRFRNGTSELMSELGLLTLFEDREGSTWLGTNGGGLHRVRDFTFRTLSQKEGLSSNAVYPIFSDRQGTLWVGAGGLHRYEHGRFSNYGVTHGLTSPQITAISEDHSGRLWVGTGDGLGFFEHDRFRLYGDRQGPLNGLVCAIHEDRNGTLWFATDHGLVRLAAEHMTPYTVADGLTHDRITALYEDRSGALWIGTFRGVTRFAHGRFAKYEERNGLIGSWVRAFHEDADGVLWAGTYDGGLYRIAGDRLTRYTRREGLHDNGVFQILEDGDGYVWMGSNRGISRVSRRELNDVAEGRRQTITPIVFGIKDGLLSIEANGGRQPPGWKTPDGRLWFPTMGGVAVVDPARVRITTTAPAALIEELQLAGRSVDVADTITVPADASTFTIRYTAPSFIKPEQIRFRYRLAGLDDDWTEAGDARSVTYHRTPPGTYWFTVIAANHHGVWSTTGASMRIVVLPPFWRTWWFAALSVAAMFAFVVIGHEIRLRGIRREHARQAAFSRQLIESEERERRRIASELHDSLGQHLAIIRQRARAGREHCTEDDAIGRELTTIVGVAQRIDADVKDIAHGLRPYQLDTIGLSKTLDHMAHAVAGACGLHCVTDIAAIDDAVPQEAHIHIYRIVQECLSNIVKHAKATRAEVVVTRAERALEISVRDNGIGFQTESVEGAASTGDRFGLMGIRERARILGGEVEIRSDSGQGTSVSVTIALELNT
jgi:signal transduction histidine kinase/ligand-binding sensor domain-containing protein